MSEGLPLRCVGIISLANRTVYAPEVGYLNEVDANVPRIVCTAVQDTGGHRHGEVMLAVRLIDDADPSSFAIVLES